MMQTNLILCAVVAHRARRAGRVAVPSVKLLETFPLEGLMKKVQPKGVGLRCEIHRRNGGQSTADGWEWEDAWDRLPADMRVKVAAIDVDTLEAAMHQATSTHR